ncbi:hypothetical protein Vretimale_10276 [Volvox reticuliferus]|uniref:Uncharacterized protein n=1 Tax=Volvox reticuliferus TaxID=1737510 RepID=A0A8J4LPM4_9CHLO|nr:hypothetical protein Vretifemale_564 [Volvox reticuliferus]GIM05851.1 hypothetical protein Vretimale_10276 [Volvox reticuliferus]
MCSEDPKGEIGNMQDSLPCKRVALPQRLGLASPARLGAKEDVEGRPLEPSGAREPLEPASLPATGGPALVPTPAGMCSPLPWKCGHDPAVEAQDEAAAAAAAPPPRRTCSSLASSPPAFPGLGDR